MRKFPAVKEIYQNNFSDHMASTTLRINVEQADQNMIYRRADNVEKIGPNGGRCLINRDHLNGTREEGMCVVGMEGRILKRSHWNRGDKHYVKDVLKNLNDADVDYIIWHTLVTWYELPTEEEEAAGKYYERFAKSELSFTVFLPPKVGLSWLIQSANLARNVELTEKMLILGAINNEPAYQVIYERLGIITNRFQEHVYLAGLNKTIDVCQQRGMSGVIGGISVMSWVMCGRLMITFSSPNFLNPKLTDSFTIIGNESVTHPELTYRSIYATLDRASELVEQVIVGWKALTPKQRELVFMHDPNVGLV